MGDLESLDSSFKGENSATDQRQFRCQPRLLDGAAHAQRARVHLSLTSFKPMSKCQLTCPVCLSQLDSPKTLPSLHSFCLKCIQQLPVDLEKGKHMISCSTCCKTAQVPDNGATDHVLPKAGIIFTGSGNKKLVESHKSFSLTNNHCVKFSCPAFSMAGRKVTTTLSLQTKLGSPYQIPPSLPLTCHLVIPVKP